MGRDQGEAQRVVSGLADGPHKIEVSTAGGEFLPFAQEVTLSAGQAMPLPIKLQARTVSLTISVEPAAAAVTILAGDTATQIGAGAASHVHPLAREPGVAYTLVGVAEGYQEIRLPIVFTGDPAQAVSLTLVTKAGPAVPGPGPGPDVAPDPTPQVEKKKPVKKPAKPKTAELKIGVAPGNPPADVYVDNKKEGRAPVFVKVTAGSHTVKWKWDDGKTDTQKVTVGDKESKLLKGSK